MEKVSIIIPAYNEENAIADVIESIQSLTVDGEIIVVDDGSSDQTSAIAKNAGAIVVRHPINMGYGKSLKDGILVAKNDLILITDADGTYPIKSIPLFVEKMSEGYDMLVGARQGKVYQGSALKRIARIVLKMLAEFTTGRQIPDINSGLRAFRKNDVLHYFADICNGFSFTTTLTLIYFLEGKIVGYLPIAYEKRIGHSKVRILRDALRTLQYMTETIVHYNPIKLFLLPSLFIGVISMPLGYYWNPLLYGIGIFTSITIFSLGLLAESMRRKRGNTQEISLVK